MAGFINMACQCTACIRKVQCSSQWNKGMLLLSRRLNVHVQFPYFFTPVAYLLNTLFTMYVCLINLSRFLRVRAMLNRLRTLNRNSNVQSITMDIKLACGQACRSCRTVTYFPQPVGTAVFHWAKLSGGSPRTRD